MARPGRRIPPGCCKPAVDVSHQTLASARNRPAGSAEPGGCASSCPGGAGLDDWPALLVRSRRWPWCCCCWFLKDGNTTEATERSRQRKKKRQNQKKTTLQHGYQKTGIIITCRLNGIPRHEGGGASAQPLQRRRRAAFPGGRTGHPLPPGIQSISV